MNCLKKLLYLVTKLDRNIYLTSLLIGYSSFTLADTAECIIKIQDVNKGTTYTIEQKFDYEPGQELDIENANIGGFKGSIDGWKHFDLPGGDYTCHLAFYGIDNGTMISCEYKKDGGHTFFQSDRSGLKENAMNRLTFRHGSVFVDVESNCK